jgi:hypothetical protein
MTRVLCLINNKTPIDWYSKKQSNVDTATHESEFATMRTFPSTRLLPVPTFDRKGSDNFSTRIDDPEMTCHSCISVSVGHVDARRAHECMSDKILFYHWLCATSYESAGSFYDGSLSLLNVTMVQNPDEAFLDELVMLMSVNMSASVSAKFAWYLWYRVSYASRITAGVVQVQVWISVQPLFKPSSVLD